MDRLCGQVNLLLSVNKELSARLRNLEHISRPGSPKRSVTATSNNSIRQSHKSLSVRSMPSALSPAPSLGSPQSEVSLFPEPVVPKLAHIEPANASAFEEQLHRSRVYRHAQANHSESSLLDDGLSTLALSICSSLTLGEVSNISVFALPVFANELSNAAAYDFARTTGVISLGGPTPTYANS
jgi:cell division control protein 24